MNKYKYQKISRSAINDKCHITACLSYFYVGQIIDLTTRYNKPFTINGTGGAKYLFIIVNMLTLWTVFIYMLTFTYKKTGLLIFCLFFSYSLLSAQQPQIITTREDPYAEFIPFNKYLGKNCGTIVDIHQDRYGYIWLAGTKCLSKFDGNTVKHYFKDWTPGALPASQTNCIEEDASGRLWIGTANGLCRYNYDTDCFTKVFGPDTNPTPSDTFHIRAIYADDDSLLWLESLNGWLWKTDQQNFNVIEQYQHYPTSQPYYPYHDIYRDKRGTIWIGGRGVGPFYLDQDKGRFEGFPVSDETIVPGMKRQLDLSYFHEDASGNFWMGASGGIYLYYPDSSYFHLFMQTSSWTMTEGQDGTLWFGMGRGLGRYDQLKDELLIYEPNEENIGGLQGNYIYEVFEDNYKHVWVSTNKGVFVYQPGIKGVDYLFHIPGMNETPASSSITDLVLDTDGKVWIGTENKGVDRYDPVKHSIEHFNPENTSGLVSGNVRCIQPGEKGKIYLGLWAGKGFGKLDPVKRQFSLYTFNKNNTYSDWYNDLEFDDQGNLYVGFWGAKGLTLFDTLQEKFSRSLSEKFNLPFTSRLITCLHFHQNKLWMGTTSGGLHKYDPETDISISYLNNKESGLNQEKIFDIRSDEEENIWIGANGLFYVEKDSLKAKSTDQEGMLEKVEVYGLLPYKNTDVWLMTNQGLIRYNRQFNKFSEYAHIVKLNFAENNAAAILLQDGRIMFGGMNGMALVNPRELTADQTYPEVFLSSLIVFDKVKIPNLSLSDKVTLKHNENFFTLSIGSNAWGEKQGFRYLYKLEGFNPEWIEIPAEERLARFTNVRPGTYDFKVMVTEENGEEVSQATYATISVLPPFWRTWWFALLAVVLTFSLIAFIWWNRIKSLRLSLSNAELNQKLLRLQMNPHFIFNSLFAIQNYIYSKQTHMAGNYLSDFAHLIRLILENSRHEYIPFEKEFECIDLYLKLQKLRFEDQFTYNIHFDQTLIDEAYLIPPMLAQPFLENAVEHGIKHLDRQGHIAVNYELQEKHVLFTVKDDGIGLTASGKLNRESHPGHESLAISICKERFEILKRKYGGSIEFSIEEIKGPDEQVKGTCVQFRIPVKKYD